MTTEQLIAICTVVSVVLAAAAFLRGVLKSARDRVEKEKKDRANELDTAKAKAFADGAASREGEVQRLKDQRDDARRERDEAKSEGAETLRRLNRLLDRGEQP